MAIEVNSVQVNADPAELEKFAALAHRWWDPQSEFKPLHEINPLRLGYIDATVSLNGKRVLDVGCGGGILSESMAQKGAHVTGIDLGEKALKVAQLHRLESGVDVDYKLISVEQLAEQMPESFDVVTCMEMLEHVPDPAAIVRACAKLVKPGGHVFFSTINRNPKAYLHAVIGAEYLLQLLPKGTHEYEKFIKPSELSAWARQAGLDVTALKGMTYNPLNKRYKLEADVSVNYIVHTQKISHSMILFDLDGTLVDTAPDLGRALNMQRQRHGLELLPDEVIRPFASHGSKGLLSIGFGIGPDSPEFAAMREEYLALYDQVFTDSPLLFDGIAELLEEIERSGASWGVVTNKPRRFTQPLLRAIGLQERAACIISGDDAAKAKPAPDTLLLACSQTNSQPQDCLYIGDAERDITAGRAAGMKTVLALYGYIADEDKPLEWGADYLINHPREIIALL